LKKPAGCRLRSGSRRGTQATALTSNPHFSQGFVVGEEIQTDVGCKACDREPREVGPALRVRQPEAELQAYVEEFDGSTRQNRASAQFMQSVDWVSSQTHSFATAQQKSCEKCGIKGRAYYGTRKGFVINRGVLPVVHFMQTSLCNVQENL
jgi:hypothetical protein